MNGLSGATVLVTGGAGFIGSHVVDRLLADDVRAVRVLDNLVNGSAENLAHHSGDPRLDLVVADLRHDETRERVTAGCDVVLHLACLGVRHSLHDPMENHGVNAEGTLLLLESARRAEVGRLVYVSTSEVFGTAQYAPMDEVHPTWPETVYGGSKLAGEAYARAYHRTHGMDTVVVRPFNTYGPRSHYEGDSGEVLPRTVVRVLAGERPLVYGDGEQTRDLMFVTDTAALLTRIASADGVAGTTINLGSGSEVSVLQMCDAVASAAGRPDLTPVHLEPRPGDVRRLIGDPTLARRLTGLVPEVSFQEGVVELVEWIRSRPQTPAELLARVSDRNWLVAQETQR
ncbi:dTDP-glucose 4,6-dehydratase [Aquipuribacter sp. MA13-6]|uniref:dTDP-glucose 4,6-dehydratase n=1 Tax=unclassified Aquipuribacter TaxID=2635084 RepID=UPI003EED5AFC